MEIIVINKALGQWTAEGYQSKIEAVLNLAASYLGYQKKFRHSALSVVLADDKFVRGLNNVYRGQNKPSNILSFAENPDINDWPEESEDYGLGDLVLSFDTIMQESRDQGKVFEHHLYHLLIHGFLHLLGYDHVEAEAGEVMEALEIDILQKLDISNPYNID